MDPSPPLLIALGNEYRSDDGVGLAVMTKLRSLHPDLFTYVHHTGDPAALVELWSDRDTTVVDAVQSRHHEPGELVVLDPLQKDGLPTQKQTSSHALSLAEALELGQVLGRLPKSLRVIGVVSQSFDPGNHLSAAVKESIPLIMEQVKKRREILYA